ncbi:DUF72 domain-containing protein [Gracilibacillus sp. YIM 98692]|uniref:DUF72 domain-containing protein n=1 Tax=Gracilibacillus sp. YIM 98692 TaxID=2663532 RepID=UPI0013D1807F|nr:DUF72 domain-containing protein [Gracilibacillus sp. YIM 98692]
MTILIGLTGWGDHHTLYNDNNRSKHKLWTYSSHFPVVEIDSSFYAIQPIKNYQKWVEQTPEHFSFVIKAYQSLTGHDRKLLTNLEAKDIVNNFKKSIKPVVDANKLHSVLFQFPPWFHLTSKNINKLKKLKKWMEDIPVSVEFRNRTWYGEHTADTISFLEQEGWIHTICDEPQAGEGSIPVVLEASSYQSLIRMHGRNVHGWNNHGQENWREVRFLYRYNEIELQEWVERIRELQKQVNQITILFNNNSGGDASDNAKQLQQMLNIEYKHLHPKQMDFFDLM